MGLDGVELLMEVENTFDIKIPDNEAASIATVSDLYEAVWVKINSDESEKCSSSMLFYKLRAYLLSKFNLTSEEFTINANLNDLITKELRKSNWERIQQDFEYKLPNLEFPELLKRILEYLGFIIILGSLIFAIIAVNFFNFSKLTFGLPVLGIGLMIVFIKILRSLKSDIGYKSIKEFVNKVLVLNQGKIRAELGVNRNEMEEVINNLIHEKIGVSYSEIVPEAHLVNDLGIN